MTLEPRGLLAVSEGLRFVEAEDGTRVLDLSSVGSQAERRGICRR